MGKTSVPVISTSRDNGAKYEQLREHLVGMIRSGQLGPGEMLPSENQLAVSVKVARNTVRQTLGELERRGVVRRVQGRGTFVTEQAMDRLFGEKSVYALIVPDIQEGYYPSLQKGFSEQASGMHSQMLVCDSSNDILRQADTIIQLVDKKVAGVAIVPVAGKDTPPHQVRLLQSNHIPVVFCHRRPANVLAPLLSTPLEEVGYLAGRTLAERGHKRVAFIGRHALPACEPHLRGFRAALQDQGLRLEEADVRFGEHEDRSSSEAYLQGVLDALFGRPVGERPTAIFSSFDPEAERIYLMLGRMGLRVPEEVSLISFGGAWRNGAIAEKLTSVVVDESSVGARAAAMLSEMRSGARAMDSDECQLLEVGLYEGETVAMR